MSFSANLHQEWSPCHSFFACNANSLIPLYSASQQRLPGNRQTPRTIRPRGRFKDHQCQQRMPISKATTDRIATDTFTSFKSETWFGKLMSFHTSMPVAMHPARLSDSVNCPAPCQGRFVSQVTEFSTVDIPRSIQHDPRL